MEKQNKILLVDVDLDATHKHVMEEFTKIAPQLEGSMCECGPKQVCKLCPPSKKIQFLEHSQQMRMQKTGLGPMRALKPAEVRSDSISSRKVMKKRMKQLRLVAQKKLGRKLSDKEFAEITDSMARDIFEKERKAVCTGCGHAKHVGRCTREVADVPTEGDVPSSTFQCLCEVTD